MPYPCRCGETHTGDYAIYDYGHHNCFHNVDLIKVLMADEDERDMMLLCPDCGKHWYVEP